MMQDQPSHDPLTDETNQQSAMEPAATTPAPMMMDSYQTQQEADDFSWLGKFWGLMMFIVLTGPFVGIPLWWVWGRSPLRAWVKLVISILLIAIFAAIIYRLA